MQPPLWKGGVLKGSNLQMWREAAVEGLLRLLWQVNADRAMVSRIPQTQVFVQETLHLLIAASTQGREALSHHPWGGLWVWCCRAWLTSKSEPQGPRPGTICLLISTWSVQQPHPGRPLHINYRKGLSMDSQAYTLMPREAWAERR